jgi:peroxiredoxin/uncharacterized coiled-coil protein SlyX
MNRYILFGITFLCLVFLSACRSQITNDAAPTSRAAKTDDSVVARINNLEFTRSELEREMAIDQAVYRLTNGRELVLQDPEGTLQGLIYSLLLDQQARQAGITATDEEVIAALNKYVTGKNISIKDLEAELERLGYTLTDFQTNIARDVRIEKYLNELIVANPKQQLDFSTWLRNLRKNAAIEILYEPPEKQPMMGAIAPDFTLTGLTGEQVTLSQFRGRPVVINFWATWCVPCRREMPAFQRAFETHQMDELVILAVNFEEGSDLVRPFVKELGITFEILYDSQAEVAKTYQVTGLPRTVFVDRQGVIQHIQVGEVQETLLEGLLEKVL